MIVDFTYLHRNTDTFPTQTKTWAEKTLEFKLNESLGNFSLNPQLNGEEEKKGLQQF